jgi:hypothetical protein
MDDKVVDGAFQMNCSWYFRPPATQMLKGSAHTHDSDEMIGFFGSNPQDPYDLGGEIEFWLEDEKHVKPPQSKSNWCLALKLGK